MASVIVTFANCSGLSFQLQFVKLNYVLRQELGQELKNKTRCSKVLEKLSNTPLSRKEISESFGEKQFLCWTKKSHFVLQKFYFP